MKARFVPNNTTFGYTPSTPGVYLCDVIARSIENGVPLEASAPVTYDDDESFVVDPSADIRSDRFAIAEKAQADFERAAARRMTDAASSVTPEAALDAPSLDSTTSTSTDSAPSVAVSE